MATIGAVLPGDFKIKAAKLRANRQKGMLCSFSLSWVFPDDHMGGIIELPADAPIGNWPDIREYPRLTITPSKTASRQTVLDSLCIIGGRAMSLLNKAR
ncbi:hypothetical protein ACPA9J_23600 [Pseudomonas aeruginosa]